MSANNTQLGSRKKTWITIAVILVGAIILLTFTLPQMLLPKEPKGRVLVSNESHQKQGGTYTVKIDCTFTNDGGEGYVTIKCGLGSPPGIENPTQYKSVYMGHGETETLSFLFTVTFPPPYPYMIG